MANNDNKSEIAEKRIPVTDHCHARLSEHKGKLRISFSELIEIALGAFEREQLDGKINIDKKV